MIRVLLAAFAAVWAVAAQAAVDIQQVTSPGGVKAWLVEEHSIPFTALEIRIRGGANLDREGARGSVNLMMALLEEGSGDMDAREFQTAREGLAASFGFDAYDDAVGISASMLSENRDEAVQLLRQALVEPRFDEDAIERVRGQIQSIIASDAQDPSAIAGDTFMAEAFPGHPYGTSINGTAESVAALSREDLLQAQRDTLVKDRVYVGAVGDITPEELGALLDDLLGALPAEGPAQPPHGEPALQGGVTVIPYPTPQSVVIFGHEGIERDDPDYFAAYVLNHVLGDGGFESRLMTEVREKRGLTYGIGTSLVPRDYAELWLGSFSSGNETVAEAVEIVRGIWADLAAHGVT
ncbi:MAG TPA: pitrilysin family protein, partial [Rubellimicrobium sp.]|nr:pitrilysin family protein [Rubellimicrobium sp.]